MACPNCGDERFVAKPYPEESGCENCGCSFYGSDVPARRHEWGRFRL
jgi:transcription initiation factor TFIIIB Brf1 subunit/transcription initiation factor TFIIB